MIWFRNNYFKKKQLNTVSLRFSLYFFFSTHLLGEILGDSLSENTGLRSISLAWNCIRGKGAVLLANGLGVMHLEINVWTPQGGVLVFQLVQEDKLQAALVSEQDVLFAGQYWLLTED